MPKPCSGSGFEFVRITFWEPYPDPHQSHCRSVEVSNWSYGGPKRLKLEEQSLKMKPWRVCRPMVTDLHHFDEEQNPVCIKVKSLAPIRIIKAKGVVRVRDPNTDPLHSVSDQQQCRKLFMCPTVPCFPTRWYSCRESRWWNTDPLHSVSDPQHCFKLFFVLPYCLIRRYSCRQSRWWNTDPHHNVSDPQLCRKLVLRPTLLPDSSV